MSYHTPSDDIEHKNDESNDTASGRTLPRRTLGGDGRGLNKQGQRELEESSESELKHFARFILVVKVLGSMNRRTRARRGEVGYKRQCCLVQQDMHGPSALFPS